MFVPQNYDVEMYEILHSIMSKLNRRGYVPLELGQYEKAVAAGYVKNMQHRVKFTQAGYDAYADLSRSHREWELAEGSAADAAAEENVPRYAQNAGAKMVKSISDYASARSAARALKNGRLGNNTWVFERRDANGDSCVVVILHSTPIVTYHEDGTVSLNTGGYRTTTTKARMNEVLPQFIRVSQIRREWYVYVSGEREKFYDGIRLDTGATTSHSGGPHANPDVHIDIGSHNRRVRKNPAGGRFGKFSDTVDELLYAIDHDQEVGSVDEHGWYGLVSGLLLPEARKLAEEHELDMDEFERDAKQYDWPMNAIVTEDSQGFVEVYVFKLNRDAIKSWRKIERDFG